MSKKVHGEKHVHDKMMPGEHRKHINHAAINAGMKDGIRLHQEVARTGKAPAAGKAEGVLSKGGPALSPKKEMFE